MVMSCPNISAMGSAKMHLRFRQPRRWRIRFCQRSEWCFRRAENRASLKVDHGPTWTNMDHGGLGMSLVYIIYIYIYIWRFPTMGDPQNHGFQYFNGLVLDDLGHPNLGNLHICQTSIMDGPNWNWVMQSLWIDQPKTIPKIKVFLFVATKRHLPNGIYLRFSSQRFLRVPVTPCGSCWLLTFSLMQHPRVHGAIVGHLNLSTCQTFRDNLSTVVVFFHQATLGSVYLEWSWSLGIGTDSCEAGKTQRNPYHFHLVATSILYHPISLPVSNPIGITSDGVMSLLWPIQYPRRWSSEFNKPTTNITMELLEQPCWWHPNPENHLPSS